MSQGSTPPWDSRDGGNGPGGEVYEWYQRGMELLSSGSPQAASQLLERAAEAEPDSRSIREGLARAQYDSRRYADAADSFRRIVDARPDDDYAHFGLGLSLTRLGEVGKAVEYLAIAVAMRPDVRHYERALRGARATLRARAQRDNETP